MRGRPPPPYHLSVEKVTSVPGRVVTFNTLMMSDSDYGGGILPVIYDTPRETVPPEDRRITPHPWVRYGPSFQRGRSI